VGCSPIRSYRNTEAVRSWEKDIAAFETKDREEHYSDTALLFSGSSSIRLWDSLSHDMRPYEVIQRGYGGAKLSDFAFYVKRIIHAHKTQAVVLFVANDITGAKEDKTPLEVLRLYRYIIKTIRRHDGNTKVFIVEITPTPSRWSVWPKTEQANAKVKAYCDKKREVYFIETARAFLTDHGEPNASLFREDRLHLNREGYRIWSDLIHSALDKELK
jgi:lysophospholipase L1-like esterase